MLGPQPARAPWDARYIGSIHDVAPRADWGIVPLTPSDPVRPTMLISALFLPMALVAQLRISSQPTLVIAATGAAGESRIGQVGGATRFSNGTILVLDAADNMLRRFSASGASIGSVGRQGSGPGEFQFPSWAGRCGETVFIFDPVLSRISAIGSEGSTLREIQLTPQRDVPPPHDDMRCLPGGGFAYFVDPRPSHGNAPGGSLQVSDLVLVGPDGALMRRITGITGAALIPFGNRAVPHPLAGRPRLSASSEGVRYGTGASAVVWSVSGTAAPRATPVNIPPRRATREAVEAAIEAVLERFPEVDRPNFRPMYAAAPVPETAPFFRRLVVDAEGLTWLETSLPGSRSTEWLVVDAGGRTVATLRLPGRVELHEVGRDYLIGRLVLEDGEERVVLHGVRRR